MAGLFFLLFLTLAHSVQSQQAMERFVDWIAKHNIKSRDDSHLAHIFNNWVDNDKYIKEINARNLSYTLGHNAYSGMSLEEFGEFMQFRANSESIQETKNLRGFQDVELSLPTSIDWRTKGVVSQVRDQGQCGSCWAFSGTSTIESAVAIKTGTLHDLSEQQSVSCAGLRYGNLGCNGGMYNNLFNYDSQGLCTEAEYPYTSGANGDTGSCIKTCSPIKATAVSSYVTVTPYSDNAMMTALTINTVNIAIEADTRVFQLYKQGVFDDYIGCNANSKDGATPDAKPNIDHAVVLVGYGSDTGKDYYILRNSWSSSWGESGYMRIARSSAYGKYGMCGLLFQPMYPVV
jgi:C1A family cysteine protease